MNQADAEEFTAGLGTTVAGAWRLVALGVRLEVPKTLGLSVAEWVEDRLGGYVRLAIPERRAAVAELTEEGLTQREIAAVLGVGLATVNRDVPNGTPTDDDQDVPAPIVPNGTPAVTDEERAHRQRVERDAERLRKFISGWFTFSTLDRNPSRDEVLGALVDPDRSQLEDITRRITWKT